MMSCVALTSSLRMASPAPPLPGTGADGGGRASGTSGEGDGTGGEGYSLVSEYWGNGLSIYDPEGNKIHTVMAVVWFPGLWGHVVIGVSWTTSVCEGVCQCAVSFVQG